MKYALEVWSNDMAQIVRTCRAAEVLGYDAFYYGESPTGLNLECWTVVAALAGETTRIRLGAVIANILPEYRSLVLLAKQVATVAVVSGGRVDFRTGVGASSRYAIPWWRPAGVRYPGYPERHAVLEQALPRLRDLWAGRGVRLRGDREAETFALGFSCPSIPITVAASSVMGMDLAARHADVWETSYRRPADFAVLASRFGAPRDRVARALEIDVFVAESSEGLAELDGQLRSERGSQRAEQVVSRSIHGLASDLPAQLAALESAGVDQLLLAFHDPHDISALEIFAGAMKETRARNDQREGSR